MAESEYKPSVLSLEQLAAYERQGFIEVKQAFSPELAGEMAAEIWQEFREEYDIEQDDPSTWLQPQRAPRRAKRSRLNAKLAGTKFRGVISDLRGSNNWREQKDWGGFLVTFPAPDSVRWDVPTNTWHWDAGPDTPGPFIFSFYSEVRPHGGGTLILSGSNRLLSEFYRSLSAEERQLPHKSHRKMFSEWDPWLAALTGMGGESVADRIATFMEKVSEVRGIAVQVVELCGEPGDAVFCSPMMLHAIAPNCSESPRIMRSKFFYS